MILIADNERDNIDQYIRQLGVDVSRTPLPSGDCVFEGNGPDGRCLVGCERKKLPDLIKSMGDRRLSGQQIREMTQTFDFMFLFVEGEWRPGPGGEIEHRQSIWDRTLKRNKWAWVPYYARQQERVDGLAMGQSSRSSVSYQQLLNYLTGLELRAGLIWRRTTSTNETAAQYVALYRNFNDKDWHEHHSHNQIYCGDVPVKGHGAGWTVPHGHDEGYVKPGRGRVRIVQESPTTLWRMAAQLPGIDVKAERVAEYFQTVRAMVEASPDEWQQIDGIGKKTALAAIRAINEPGA